MTLIVTVLKAFAVFTIAAGVMIAITQASATAACIVAVPFGISLGVLSYPWVFDESPFWEG
mgnify:CR=1 FL=1